MKQETRQQVHAKFDGHCAYCGEEITIKQMQVDHVIPQYRFEQNVANKFRIPVFLNHLTPDDCNHIDNLFPACRVCNKWKSSHDLEFFRHEMEMQVKRLNEYSAPYRMAKRYGQIEETERKVKFYFETLREKFYLKEKQ